MITIFRGPRAESLASQAMRAQFVDAVRHLDERDTPPSAFGEALHLAKVASIGVVGYWDHLSSPYRRMLTRLALARQGIVVDTGPISQSFIHRCELPILYYGDDSWASTEKVITETRPRPIGQGIGAPEFGKILLIGEAPAKDGFEDYPFIRWDRRGCAYWLAEQLDRIYARESELRWINAYDVEGKPNSSVAITTTSALMVSAGSNVEFSRTSTPRRVSCDSYHRT